LGLRSDAEVARFQKAQRALRDFRLSAAAAQLRPLTEHPSSAPAAYLLLTTADAYRVLATQRPAARTALTARVDTLHRVLGRRPDNRWTQWMRAQGNVYRALAAAQGEQRLQAARLAHQAHGTLERLVRTHPTWGDPYLGLGLLHHAVAMLPGTYRQILAWTGLSGTAVEGRREIAYAAAHGRFVGVEASLCLALLDLTVRHRPSDGVARLRRLHEARPQSLLYRHLYGYGLLSVQRADQAVSVLRPVAEQVQTEGVPLRSALHFLGRAYFRLGRFEAAEQWLGRYVRRADEPALQAMSHLHIGWAREMQGRRAAAVESYGRALAGEEGGSDGTRFARRWAQEALDEPMTAHERQLLRARNAFDRGDFAAAERQARAVLADTARAAGDTLQAVVTPRERGEAYYRLGRALHRQGAHAAARRAYRAVVDDPGDPRAKWAPWAQYHIARIHMAHERWQRAYAALDRATQFPWPYDYAQALEQRIKLAYEQVPVPRAQTP
jgi:tetratricopeptide (TPR) repeat protein